MACNYSPAAADLVRQGRVALDLFKCPDWPNLVAEASEVLPCYVHYPFLAGNGGLDAVDWAQVDGFLASTETTYVNTHIAPCARLFDDMDLRTQDPADAERLTEAMLRDTVELVRRYGPERVAAENVMWDPVEPWLIPEPALCPEAIGRVVRESGCRFVLDLAHASIAARHLGRDEREYVESLPLDRLIELHVTGVRDEGEDLWNDHFPMTARDWALAEWAFGRIGEGAWPRPEIVAFEYGGVGPSYEWRSDPATLSEQAPRLTALVASAQERHDNGRNSL